MLNGTNPGGLFDSLKESTMRCEQIMKRQVRTLSQADSVYQAAKLMRDENIGFVPVCDDQGRVVGTLTDRDIVVRVAAQRGSMDAPLSTTMSSDVVTCRPDDRVTEAENRMRDARKSRIVCVDEAGRPVGVISLSDLAQHERVGRVGRLLRGLTHREAHA